MSLVIVHVLGYVLERTSTARRLTGSLCRQLADKHLLTIDDFVTGLQPILEIADDMVIDVPKFWQYLGELVGPLVQHAGLSFLASTVRCLSSTRYATLLVDEVLKAAADTLGCDEVLRLWTLSHSELDKHLDQEPSFITNQKSISRGSREDCAASPED